MQQQQQQLLPVQQTTAVPPAIIPYFIIAAPAQTTLCPGFPKKRALGLAAALIVAGSLSMIFQIVELAISKENFFFDNLGHGIWIGILSIIAGSFGIGAGVKKTRGLISAFNVMCIIAASCTAVQFALGVYGAYCSGIYNHFCNNHPDNIYSYMCKGRNFRAQLAMSILLAIHAVIEAVAATWGSVICCKTYCCCSSCERNPQPAALSYGIPVHMMSSDQPMQSAGKGGDVPNHPGYTGHAQPIQFMNAQSHVFYQGQGQLPSGQLPPYDVASTNVLMYVDQKLTVPAQLPASTSSKTAEAAAAAPPPDYHHQQ